MVYFGCIKAVFASVCKQRGGGKWRRLRKVWMIVLHRIAFSLSPLSASWLHPLAALCFPGCAIPGRLAAATPLRPAPMNMRLRLLSGKKKGEAFLFLLPSFVCVAISYGWLTRLHLRICTFSGSHRCFVAGRWNAWLGSGVPSELAASAGSALAAVYAGSLRTAASLRSAPEPPSRCLRRG